MKKHLVIASVCVGFSAALAAPVPVLHIDAGNAIGKVGPLFSGMMTEEINHSYDGGLYAELIQNRVFKDNPDEPVHWSLVEGGAAAAKMSLDSANGLNEKLATSLRLEVRAATPADRAGVANDGYWGIPVKPHTRYRASFYARALALDSPVTASLESADGSQVFASATVKHLDADWQKYSVTLTTPRDIHATTNARLVLSVQSPGTVWFDLVSLFPPTWHNRPNGNRIDIMQKLTDMKPRFLRFPGGNYLEGTSIEDRFPWKETLGDLAQRPGHPCCWGYRSSDGMGLLEFLEWAEDLGAEPVLAVYAGYSLPPKSEVVQAGPDLQPYVQDALDEIEYVIGDTSTKWGARRAADGHPKPFQLTYVEIGNEDWFDKGSYDPRFAQFFDAIKSKYPQLQCISTVGNEQPEGKRVHSRKPDVLDEHYYRSADTFEREGPTRFEKYDRTGPKIFVGEWAAYESIVPWNERSRRLPPTPAFKAALGDAAWTMAMERNADLIVMQCYAPMLVNVNPRARQWRPDLIGYDAMNSFGSPSYYVIAMLNADRGDTVVKTSVDGLPDSDVSPLDYSVTKDTKKGTIYIHLANVTDAPLPLRIDIDGVKKVSAHGTAVTLTAASLDAGNSIANPTNVAPVTEKIDGLASTFTRTLAPYSVTVLKLRTQ